MVSFFVACHLAYREIGEFKQVRWTCRGELLVRVPERVRADCGFDVLDEFAPTDDAVPVTGAGVGCPAQCFQQPMGEPASFA